MSEGKTSKMECASCRLPRAQQVCGICDQPVCRSCEQRVALDAFDYRKNVPEELKKGVYCGRCYDEHVAPEIARYEETMAQAREVVFVPRTYRGRLLALSKAKERISVEACPDRNESIMRLAFQAVELGFNALIEGEVSSAKLRNHGYQTTRWSGSALPANLDERALRDFE